MAIHAENTLGRPRIAEVLNLPFAVTATEALSTEGLVAGENSQILDLVTTRVTAIGTVAADQGSVTEEEEVGVRVEEGTAGAAAETVDMPSLAG